MNHAGNRPLPEGWRWVRLRTICEGIKYGFTTSADFSATEPRFLRITDIQNGRVNWETVPGCRIIPRDAEENSLADGDIVFARTGGTTGKTLLIEQPPAAVFASYLIRMRLKKEVNPEYIYAFFQSNDYWEQIRLNARGGAQPNLNATLLSNLTIPLPPLSEQKRIAAILNEQMTAVERARAATEAQLELLTRLIESYFRHSLSTVPTQPIQLNKCLREVTQGIGAAWQGCFVVGATRAGAAPARENVGKKPERYKFVDAGTIFYNPMRILLGSIGMIDVDDEPGITSPDYVVFKTQNGVLHPRWFYFWLRSRYGEAFIKTLTRGAVRERMLFKRLSSAHVEIPPWKNQVDVAEKLRIIIKTRRTLLEQLNTINILPAAILRRAFSGEL